MPHKVKAPRECAEIVAAKEKIINNLHIKLHEARKFPPDPTPDRVRLIQKSPKYYWSLMGVPIIHGFCRDHDVTVEELGVLVVVSMYKCFFPTDIRNWRYHHHILKKIFKKGYLQNGTIMVLTPNRIRRPKNIYALTVAGKVLVDSYEAYFDKCMAEFSKLPGGKDIKQQKAFNTIPLV